MKAGRIRRIIIQASLAGALGVTLVIAGAAHLILEDVRESIFEDTRVQAAIFAMRAGTVMAPREDKFFLHVLASTIVQNKIIRHALITDRAGRIVSHSDAEMIGNVDKSAEGRAARQARQPLQQDLRGPDGLERHYFSSPIVLGNRRLGTAALVIDSQTMEVRLAAVRHRLLLILLSALLALVLLAEILALTKKIDQASELKSSMVRTVSHEFNNALTVFDTGIYLLKDSEPDKDSPIRRELYSMIEDKRKSLGLYVKNLLNEARLEAGRFKPEKRPLALRDLVKNAVAAHEVPLRERKIVCSLDMPDAPVLVDADHEALALVVSNLIGNAVKYTPDGGRIEVRLTPEGNGDGKMTLSVENSGSGISESDQKRLSEEFFRTREGQAAASGFGLGLGICHEMLTLHGSRLEVRSEPGKNTCFYFSLPVIAAG